MSFDENFFELSAKLCENLFNNVRFTLLEKKYIAGFLSVSKNNCSPIYSKPNTCQKFYMVVPSPTLMAAVLKSCALKRKPSESYNQIIYMKPITKFYFQFPSNGIG